MIIPIATLISWVISAIFFYYMGREDEIRKKNTVLIETFNYFHNLLEKERSNCRCKYTSDKAIDISKMTWSCKVCGDIREDKFISVVSHDVSMDIGLPKGTIIKNIRYCNDRERCMREANMRMLWIK